MINKDTKITIIGAGSWGTTLAVVLARSGYDIDLWARSKSTFEEILKQRRNTRYTGDLVLPDNIKPVTGNPEQFRSGTDIILLAVP